MLAESNLNLRLIFLCPFSFNFSTNSFLSHLKYVSGCNEL